MLDFDHSVFQSSLDYGDLLFMNAPDHCLDAVYHCALHFITARGYLVHHCTLYAPAKRRSLYSCRLSYQLDLFIDPSLGWFLLICVHTCVRSQINIACARTELYRCWSPELKQN